MRICKVYDGDYPWDVRVEKVLSTLVGGGHEVHLVCRNLLRRPENEIEDGVHIHRLRGFESHRWAQLLTFPAFFNPLWISKIASVVRKHAIDLLLVRDLPLALAASAVGKRYRIPVILDMAENYPAMLQDVWKFDSFRLSNIVLRNPLLAKAIESIAIRSADHLLVVIEESMQRLVGLGVELKKISIVRNTPRLDGLKFRTEYQDEGLRGSTLSVVFVGGLEPLRGLGPVMEMLPAALRAIPSLRLKIVGGGKWEQDLKTKAQSLGLNGHIVFTGRTDYSRALSEVSQSDIGIIPHRVTAHTSSTIPNKLFEYMLLGKPVIATEIGPVSRIIREVDCGFTYSDETGFVSVLVALKDPAIRTKLGENGRKAVLEKYNWEQESRSLIDAVAALRENFFHPN
jgi:glycosyltransferase involved in cell wall biosynthesis